MTRSEIAVEKHNQGYNCAQSVVCTFADKLGIEESLLYKMAEGFGAGMGTGKGVCGAMAGVAMISGLVNSNGDIENAGATKAISTRTAGMLSKDFIERVGALYCRDIKEAATTSCSDCIAIAAELAEEAFFK